MNAYLDHRMDKQERCGRAGRPYVTSCQPLRVHLGHTAHRCAGGPHLQQWPSRHRWPGRISLQKILSQLSSVRDCGLNLSNKYHNKNGASAAAHHSQCQPCSSRSSARYCWWDWVKAAAGCAASHRILAASRPLCSDPAPWWSHSSHRSSSCRRIW